LGNKMNKKITKNNLTKKLSEIIEIRRVIDEKKEVLKKVEQDKADIQEQINYLRISLARLDAEAEALQLYKKQK